MKFTDLKSVHSYRMELPPLGDLETAIEQMPFVELTEHQLDGRGFVANKITGELVNPLFGNRTGYAFAMQFAERVILKATVDRLLLERIEQLEFTEQRKVYSKERRELATTIRMELAPTAPIKFKTVHGFYHATSRRLFVSGASRKQADSFTEALVHVLGSVKAETIYIADCKKGITAQLTYWLDDQHHEEEGDAFGAFTVGGYVRIADPKDSSQLTQLKADDLSLASLGLRNTLKLGYLVERIELELDGTVFHLDSTFRVKGVKYPETEPADDENDDLPWHWRNEATIRVLILSDIFDKLTEMLGHGEEVETVEPEPAETEPTVDDLI